MGLETFPEIESFQKLPHQVIVKGGAASFSKQTGGELRGIVINNIGQPICELKVSLVIFDQHKLPIMSISKEPESTQLAQGGIAPFIFQLKELSEPIRDYYLYANWKFDDSE